MNPQVLLIVGNEHRFVEPLVRVETYARRDCKISSRNVTMMFAAYHNKQGILDDIFDTAEKAQRRHVPLVLFYYGHGYRGGISPNGDNVDYADLAAVLKNTPFLFVDATCHSGSSIDAFRKEGLLPAHGSVIADAPADRETAAGSIFLSDVVESWGAGKPFMKKRGLQKVGGEIVIGGGRADGTDTIEDLDFRSEIMERVYTPIRRKTAIVYEAVRCGKALDYLMFPKIHS